MSEGQDRRRGLRVRVAAFATLETRGVMNANNQALCSVQDVSRTGIGLQTGQPPLVGQGVLLRLDLEGRVHELPTLATRVRRRGETNFYDVGLDWSCCTPAQLKFLDEVLQAFQKQSP